MTLFDAPPKRTYFDAVTEFVREKFKLGAGWKVYCIDTGDGRREAGVVQVEGATPVGVYKSGKRKGRTKWDGAKDTRTLNYIRADFDAWEVEWSKRTGLCPDCYGDGKTMTKASASGTEYRPCEKCAGTGKRAGGA